jgi:AraC family transcriptional regulator
MRKHDAVPTFFKQYVPRIDPSAELRGAAEGFGAPFTLIASPKGFSEETWVSDCPDTILSLRLDGAHVTCRGGPKSGATSANGSCFAFSPKGSVSKFTAQGSIRFAQIYVSEGLIDRAASFIHFAPKLSTRLRDDLVFASNSTLEGLARQYLDAGLNGATTLEMEARALLLMNSLLAAHYDESFERTAIESKRGGLAPHQLNRVTDYLMARLADDIALAELAAIASLSPHHFCRAFKQSTGLPPHAWLAHKRMERAQEMMAAHPQMGLTEIALCVGYQSQAAFGAAFKRVTGATPSQLRRGRAG